MVNFGILTLVIGYVLSQFYRAMLAVMSQPLFQDIGASAEDLATASGIWFLCFGLMQLPVGAALDRIGPRKTCAILFIVAGGGGAFVFSAAQAPWHITVAMGLIGVGCSPVLMSSYFIFAKTLSPALFATAGAMVIGFGSLGNILSALPLAYVVDSFGWRGTMLGLAVATPIVGLLILGLVRDPPKVRSQHHGSVFDLLKLRELWPILAMMSVNYIASGGLRGLWVGPYTVDIYGATAQQVGTVSLVMGLAMVAGNFAYGPLDRLLHTRKWVILGGNSITLLCLVALTIWPESNLWRSAALFAMIGAAGSSFAVVIAHGRSFFPTHLTGRGVTLMNLFGISGVGLGQLATGWLSQQSADPITSYRLIFGFFSLVTFCGMLIYSQSRDRLD